MSREAYYSKRLGLKFNIIVDILWFSTSLEQYLICYSSKKRPLAQIAWGNIAALGNDLGDHSRANGVAAFSDCKPKAFFHSNRNN